MDLISRQAAIDAVTKYCLKYDLRELLADIECLPPFEPDAAMCWGCNCPKMPGADLSEYCDKLWKTAYERGKAEVHPKKGKWENSGEWEEHGTVRYYCSQCGCDDWHFPLSKISYCWNCGARMEESE